jgi:hypothetical protein
MDVLWIIILGGGTIALGLAIAFGIMRNKQRTPYEEARTEQATHNLYDKEEADRRATSKI